MGARSRFSTSPRRGSARPRCWSGPRRASSPPERSGRSPRSPARGWWPRPGPVPTWSARWSNGPGSTGSARPPARYGPASAGTSRSATARPGPCWTSGRWSTGPASCPGSSSPPVGPAGRTTPRSRRCPVCCACRCLPRYRPRTRRSRRWAPSPCTGCAWPTSGRAPRWWSSGLAWSASSPPGSHWPADATWPVSTSPTCRWPQPTGPASSLCVNRTRPPRPRCCAGPVGGARTPCWSVPPPGRRISSAGCRRCAGTARPWSLSGTSGLSSTARPSTTGNCRCASPARTVPAATSGRTRTGGWTTRPVRSAGQRAATWRPSSTCWPPAG